MLPSPNGDDSGSGGNGGASGSASWPHVGIGSSMNMSMSMSMNVMLSPMGLSDQQYERHMSELLSSPSPMHSSLHRPQRPHQTPSDSSFERAFAASSDRSRLMDCSATHAGPCHSPCMEYDTDSNMLWREGSENDGNGNDTGNENGKRSGGIEGNDNGNGNGSMIHHLLSGNLAPSPHSSSHVTASHLLPSPLPSGSGHADERGSATLSSMSSFPLSASTFTSTSTSTSASSASATPMRANAVLTEADVGSPRYILADVAAEGNSNSSSSNSYTNTNTNTHTRSCSLRMMSVSNTSLNDWTQSGLLSPTTRFMQLTSHSTPADGLDLGLAHSNEASSGSNHPRGFDRSTHMEAFGLNFDEDDDENEGEGNHQPPSSGRATALHPPLSCIVPLHSDALDSSSHERVYDHDHEHEHEHEQHSLRVPQHQRRCSVSSSGSEEFSMQFSTMHLHQHAHTHQPHRPSLSSNSSRCSSPAPSSIASASSASSVCNSGSKRSSIVAGIYTSQDELELREQRKEQRQKERRASWATETEMTPMIDMQISQQQQQHQQPSQRQEQQRAWTPHHHHAPARHSHSRPPSHSAPMRPVYHSSASSSTSSAYQDRRSVSPLQLPPSAIESALRITHAMHDDEDDDDDDDDSTYMRRSYHVRDVAQQQRSRNGLAHHSPSSMPVSRATSPAPPPRRMHTRHASLMNADNPDLAEVSTLHRDGTRCAPLHQHHHSLSMSMLFAPGRTVACGGSGSTTMEVEENGEDSTPPPHRMHPCRAQSGVRNSTRLAQAAASHSHMIQTASTFGGVMHAALPPVAPVLAQPALPTRATATLVPANAAAAAASFVNPPMAAIISTTPSGVSSMSMSHNAASSTSTAAAAASASASASTSSSTSTGQVRFRLDCGSDSSRFEYNGLPILWRKASAKKDAHALVRTYIYLYPRVESVQHITLHIDGHSIRIPKSNEVNVKNAHLCNFVLRDEEQNALFQIVQNENCKRKPDVLVRGVKLHAMYLTIMDQRIDFYYCAQKRIAIEKAFTSLYTPSCIGTGSGGSSSSSCSCFGQCLQGGLQQLSEETAKFLTRMHIASQRAKKKNEGDMNDQGDMNDNDDMMEEMILHDPPPSSSSKQSSSSQREQQASVPYSIRASLTPSQHFDRLLTLLNHLQKSFIAHRAALLRLRLASRNGASGAGSGADSRSTSPATARAAAATPMRMDAASVVAAAASASASCHASMTLGSQPSAPPTQHNPYGRQRGPVAHATSAASAAGRSRSRRRATSSASTNNRGRGRGRGRGSGRTSRSTRRTGEDRWVESEVEDEDEESESEEEDEDDE